MDAEEENQGDFSEYTCDCERSKLLSCHEEHNRFVDAKNKGNSRRPIKDISNLRYQRLRLSNEKPKKLLLLETSTKKNNHIFASVDNNIQKREELLTGFFSKNGSNQKENKNEMGVAFKPIENGNSNSPIRMSSLMASWKQQELKNKNFKTAEESEEYHQVKFQWPKGESANYGKTHENQAIKGIKSSQYSNCQQDDGFRKIKGPENTRSSTKNINNQSNLFTFSKRDELHGSVNLEEVLKDRYPNCLWYKSSSNRSQR